MAVRSKATPVVITAGPWTARLLPNLPGARATNRRSPALLEACEDSAAYEFPNLTPFSVMDTQFYGFPVHWRGCVKVADDMIGEPFDP